MAALLDSKLYRVFAVYAESKQNQDDLSNWPDLKHVHFKYENMNVGPLCDISGMQPSLRNIASSVCADLLISFVWADYQRFLVTLPRNLHTVLISPFGHYANNGRVGKIYVSGKDNLRRVRSFGQIEAELLYNPLRIPEFNIKKFENVDRKIIFGRTGRSDSDIFDPISILAFKRLEDKYGELVEFWYVNPCPEAIALVAQLSIKNIKMFPWLDEDELEHFYRTIHIFAHARRDGETCGIAIAEALTYQNVVITHRSQLNNDHIELIKEPFGLIAEEGDIDSYFLAMCSFIENRENLAAYGNEARLFSRSLFGADEFNARFLSDVASILSPATSNGNVAIKIENVLRMFLVPWKYRLAGILSEAKINRA